ncbi:MAG: hypothetical protein B7Z46_01360 [Hydrogenophilales bacterium 12-64-6]|nr:MAG: hypothetical protein B7Z46_01360 [Hydrogenophilales bacterium 12-64-6]
MRASSRYGGNLSSRPASRRQGRTGCLAGIALGKRQPDQAIGLYQQVLKISPRHVMALNNLAAVLQERNAPSAQEFALRAYQAQPDNPIVMDTYGWSLVQLGKIQEALPLLQQAALAMPKVPAIQYHLASGLAKSGKTVEAQTLLQKLLSVQTRFSERGEAEGLLKSLTGPGKH